MQPSQLSHPSVLGYPRLLLLKSKPFFLPFTPASTHFSPAPRISISAQSLSAMSRDNYLARSKSRSRLAINSPSSLFSDPPLTPDFSRQRSRAIRFISFRQRCRAAVAVFVDNLCDGEAGGSAAGGEEVPRRPTPRCRCETFAIKTFTSRPCFSRGAPFPPPIYRYSLALACVLVPLVSRYPRFLPTSFFFPRLTPLPGTPPRPRFRS